MIELVRDVTERVKVESELLELKGNLESQVEEKTKDLNEKAADLQNFSNAAVNRELRMKELNDEIKSLRKELKSKKIA